MTDFRTEMTQAGAPFTTTKPAAKDHQAGAVSTSLLSPNKNTFRTGLSLYVVKKADEMGEKGNR